MVSLRSLVTGVALIAAPVMAVLSPTELVESIKELTQKSEALKAPVQSISAVNAPLMAIGKGPLPAIWTGGADVLATATVLMSNLDGIPQDATEDDLDAILNAFRECVGVNRELLQLVISKSDLIKKIPILGAPATILLGPLEAFANAIADFTINISVSWVEEVKTQANSPVKSVTGKRAEVFVA